MPRREGGQRDQIRDGISGLFRQLGLGLLGMTGQRQGGRQREPTPDQGILASPTESRVQAASPHYSFE
jgi:hypothetical protein